MQRSSLLPIALALSVFACSSAPPPAANSANAEATNPSAEVSPATNANPEASTLLSGAGATSSTANAAPPAANAADPAAGFLPYDALLSGYPYPYPVRYFETQSQGVDLRIAYMLLEPAPPSQGPTRTIVLFHGKNFSGAYWKSTADALLAQGYRVVMIDQVGFGKSTKAVDFQYSFQELARLSHALLSSIGSVQVTVVGHSMGGMLATRYALMYPEATEALVLLNPIGLEDWKLKVPYKSVDDWQAANLKATAASIKEYMRTSYFDGKWKPEYDALVSLQAGLSTGPDRALIAQVSALHYDMIFTQPVLYEFSQLSLPTLLVIGQRDRTAIGKAWVSPEVAATLGNYPELGRAAHAAISQSELVELPGIGHAPQAEDFDAWMEALGAFLSAHP